MLDIANDLGNIISKRRTDVHDLAHRAIDRLISVANDLGDSKLTASLRQVDLNLADDRFRLIVVGRFNNGKSTFLNALLGEAEVPVDLGGGDLLPSLRRPTTAVLSDIVHADHPYARIHRLDGASEEMTLERFHIESRVRNTAEENVAFFDPIRRFEVGFPAKLLRSVTLSDSPGISDIPMRTAITREAIDESDVALTLYRSETPAGHDELEFAEEVKASGCRLFTVINLIAPDHSGDPELLEFIWDRLVGKREGAPTIEQFAQLDIFFVDALAALEARKTHDAARLEGSGLPLFERRLADFLLREKFVTHTARYITRAERIADSVEQDLRTREVAHRASAADLRAMIDKLRPQIDKLRDQRRALDLTIDRYAQVFAATAQQSFVDFVQTLGEPLIEELDKEEFALESLKNWGGAKAIVSPEQRKRIGEELVGQITTILKRQVTSWASDRSSPNGLIAALAPDFMRFTQEIEAQVRQMDEAIEEGRLDGLGGEDEVSIVPSLSGLIEQRMLSDFGDRGKIGAMVGGGLASVLVATIGLKISLMIASAILVALGILLNPLMILGVIVAALIGGCGLIAGMGMEKSIKKKAVEAVLHELPLNHDAIASLRQAVVSKYRSVITSLTETVGAAIEDEERRLRTLIGANEADGEQQAAELNKLATRFATVNEARALLTQARTDLDAAA